MEHFRLVIISGVSGSGKSTALNAFDDIGYFCVDNLPAPLINNFVDYLQQVCSGQGLQEQGKEALPHHFALLVRCRELEFFPQIWSAVERLKKAGTEVILLYFDCQDDVVVRRFQETRRPHPLMSSTGLRMTVREALAKERDLLVDFRAAADRIIDTSAYTPHDLRRTVETYFHPSPQDGAQLELSLLSFGFKYGIPVHADLVFDARFLPNPHFVPELKNLTGEDTRVQDFVFQNTSAVEFLGHVSRLLRFLLPHYKSEGKRYVTVAIGCTGGRHRSVAIVERLSKTVGDLQFRMELRHRDIERPVS